MSGGFMWSPFCVGGLFNATAHSPYIPEMKARLFMLPAMFTANQTDEYTKIQILGSCVFGKSDFGY